jgi:hypothetical protein
MADRGATSRQTKPISASAAGDPLNRRSLFCLPMVRAEFHVKHSAPSLAVATGVLPNWPLSRDGRSITSTGGRVLVHTIIHSLIHRLLSLGTGYELCRSPRTSNSTRHRSPSLQRAETASAAVYSEVRARSNAVARGFVTVMLLGFRLGDWDCSHSKTSGLPAGGFPAAPGSTGMGRREPVREGPCVFSSHGRTLNIWFCSEQYGQARP